MSIEIDGNLRTHSSNDPWAPTDQDFIFFGNGYYDNIMVYDKADTTDPVTHTTVNSSDAGTVYYDFTGIPLSRNNIRLAGQLTPNAIKLNWKINNPNEFDQIYLERASKNGLYQVVFSATVNINQPTKFVDTLAATQLQNQKVNYRVRAITKNGQVKYSNTTWFTINQNKPVLFPVPTRQLLNIKSPVKFNQINIFSLTGNLVKTVPIGNLVNQYTINTANLPKGCYILRIENDRNHIGREKFVKN